MFVIYAALVILASLNRETGLLLVACYAAYHGGQWRARGYWLQVGTLGAVWGIITLTLHLAYGAAPHVLGLKGTLIYNLSSLPEALLSNVIFMPLWFIVIRSYRHSPPVLKRLVVVALAYIATIVVGAAWQEIRLLLTAFPLLLPMVLYRVDK